MKGQINLEFLASAMLYLLALGAVVTASSAVLPTYSQETRKAKLNLEARSMTFRLLTEEGRHSFGGGGTNWEYNNTTRAATTELGLSNGEDFHVARDKIMALKTVGENYFNYTQFRKVTAVSNQYRFRFTWMPVVQTDGSFTRNSPPSDPPIQEPRDEAYRSADNEVHYGSTVMRGLRYHFLVTAKNGIYNATYVSSDWDFENAVPIGVGEKFTLTGIEYEVESLQNREGDRGAVIVLKRRLNTFGANLANESTVVKLNRYAVLEGEPLRIGVWTW
ncbi:MAG: hypothetical protein ABEJ98_05345 [Candidatus Nanohaloarchaea archaeon]